MKSLGIMGYPWMGTKESDISKDMEGYTCTDTLAKTEIDCMQKMFFEKMLRTLSNY